MPSRLSFKSKKMSHIRQSPPVADWMRETQERWRQVRLRGEELHQTSRPGHPAILYTLQNSANEFINGCILISNYRFFFHGVSRSFNKSSFYALAETDNQTPTYSFGFDVDLPLGTIADVKKKDSKPLAFEVVSKDFRPSLLFQSYETARKTKTGSTAQARIVSILQDLVFCPMDQLFAFKNEETFSNYSPIDGWHVYQPYREFDRLGICNPDCGWKITELNKDYQLVETYPFLLPVPKETSDEQLRRVVGYRSKGRLPVLSWIHPQHRAALVRCSQPQSGLKGKRCTEDEEMFRHVCSANRSSMKRLGDSASSISSLLESESDGQFIIFDARPRLNAHANRATGGGIESSRGYKGAKYKYLDIANIHVMRSSLAQLHELVHMTDDSAGWLRMLDKTEWLQHLHRVLEGARQIALQLERQRRSVLLHCSDGWDRTAQLSSLVMLMLDPFYRTLSGFPVLIEKEWLSLGHKFQDRTSQGLMGQGDEEASPIFLQFLDALWQLMRQFPHAFEFNSAYLVEIMDAVYSCRFGTFLFNCEKERQEVELRQRTQSVWVYLKASGEDGKWSNVLYRPPSLSESPVLMPRTEVAALDLWRDYYFRWVMTQRERSQSSFSRRLSYFISTNRRAIWQSKSRSAGDDRMALVGDRDIAVVVHEPGVMI